MHGGRLRAMINEQTNDKIMIIFFCLLVNFKNFFRKKKVKLLKKIINSLKKKLKKKFYRDFVIIVFLYYISKI